MHAYYLFFHQEGIHKTKTGSHIRKESILQKMGSVRERRRRRKRLRPDVEGSNNEDEVIVISSDDEESSASKPAASSRVFVTDDEQRLLDGDQELNDSVVNRYLQLIVDRFHQQLRRNALEDHHIRATKEEEDASNGAADDTHQQPRGSPPVLVNVSTHFLPRWRSLWREIEDVQKSSTPSASDASTAPSLDVGLAQRMRGWIGGRGLPSTHHYHHHSSTAAAAAPQEAPPPITPPPAHQLCLRHWIALYDIPMRHVYAPRQHSIDTKALLDEHLATGCTQCFSSACVLFPVHVPKQHHWIMAALLIPRLRQWPPAKDSRMPLGKVHVYDSMLWLHHRYSRCYPFDDDEDEAMSGPQSRATAEWMRTDEDDIVNQNACDGRRYRRMLLHRTVRPLLAAVQLIAMHRIMEAPNAASFVSTTATQHRVTRAFPRLHRWRVRWHRYSVTQQNAVDCGVAVCKAADHISQSLASIASRPLGDSHVRRAQQRRQRRHTLLREVDCRLGASGSTQVYRRHLFRAAADLHMLYWRCIERSDLREYRTTMHRWMYPQEPTVIEDNEEVSVATSAPVSKREDSRPQRRVRANNRSSSATLMGSAANTARRRRRRSVIEDAEDTGRASRRRPVIL